MFESIYVLIALIGSTIAGVWDFKTTNIPDSVCIGMIVSGILLHGYESYSLGSLDPLMSSFLVGGLFLLFGLIMYYTGQWGGGDGELLAAIGFLLPTATAPTFFAFPISFFVNLILISAIYGIGYTLYLMVKPGVKRKGLMFYRRIPVSKLKVDDVLGEDLPRLKLFKKKIKGLTKEDIKKIKRYKKFVTVTEGIPTGIVFPIALAFTLYFGDLILLLV